MNIQKRFRQCIQLVFTLLLLTMLVGLGQSVAEAVEDGAFETLQIMRLPEPAEPYDFTLASIDGEEKKLSDYLGNVIFLNFWATW